MGSSPLTRGKLPSHQPFQFSLGLIPAHAGKTLPEATDADPYKAHPRSRGENDLADGEGVTLVGSSPLTRGKRAWRHCRGSCARLIPAHAGKTCQVSSVPSR